MGQINAAMIYVLFPSTRENSPVIVHRILSIPADGETGPVYKVVDAISAHIGKEIPPASAIATDGMALKLYFRNSTCQGLAIKPLKSSPLLSITKPEWEIAKAQIANPSLGSKNIEETISAATSTIPKIICLNDQGAPQSIIQSKNLPKSAVFAVIVILGLICALAVVLKTSKNTFK